VHAAIESERLRLRTLTPAFLHASLDGDIPRAEALLGARLPAGWPDDPALLGMRLAQIETDPGMAPWLIRLMEHRAEQRIVGVVGFHGPPGGEWLRELAPGGVELGYTVDPAWRRQGLALEACRALIDWAVRSAGVTRFALSMRPDNAASAGLAGRLGFVRVGSWEHAARGTEHVYRLDVVHAPV